MRSSPFGGEPSAPDPLDPGPAGFAHRGFHSAGVPENSLAAFRAAIRIGAGIECDIRLSADGEAMIFHDHDLARLCGESLAFASLPPATLASKHLLRTGERIPRLAELLTLSARRVPLLLELKTEQGNAGRLCAAVSRAIGGSGSRIGVMSFDPGVGAWFRRHRPDVRRGLVLSERDGGLGRWLKVARAGPQFLAVELPELSGEWVRRARGRGPVYAWTVRTRSEAAQVAVQADAAIWEGDLGKDHG